MATISPWMWCCGPRGNSALREKSICQNMPPGSTPSSKCATGPQAARHRAARISEFQSKRRGRRNRSRALAGLRDRNGSRAAHLDRGELRSLHINKPAFRCSGRISLCATRRHRLRNKFGAAARDVVNAFRAARYRRNNRRRTKRLLQSCEIIQEQIGRIVLVRFRHRSITVEADQKILSRMGCLSPLQVLRKN